MDKAIAVVDLTTGALQDRATDTLTLDIPRDFDRQTGGVFVDADRLGRYRTTAGATRVYLTSPRHLSQRSPGEECLVAAQDVDSSGAAIVRRYWRSVIEPTSHA